MFGSRNTKEEEILAQAEKLHEDGKYLESISYLERLPQAARTGKVELCLARAYANCAVMDNTEKPALDFETSALLSRVVDLAHLAAAKDHSVKAKANFLAGRAALLLESPGIALPYLEDLADDAPDDAEARNMLEYARREEQLPLHITTFIERARTAWDLFSQKEEAIRAFVQAGQMQIAFDLAERCLFTVASSDFLIAQDTSTGAFKLILSCEHWKHEMFKLALFKDLAPEDVAQTWEIVIGYERCDNADYLLPNKAALYASDVRAYPEFHEQEGDFSLTAYIPQLAGYVSSNTQGCYKALMSLVDETVGELVSMRYINGMELVDKEPDGQAMTLIELRDFIDAHVDAALLENDVLLDECLAQEYDFTRIPSQDATSVPGDRSDTFMGTSGIPEVVDEFFDNDTFIVDDAMSCGAVVGYFYWDSNIVLDDPSTIEQGYLLMSDIMNYIYDAAGETALSFIGGAFGTDFCYADFVAWDFPVAIQAARTVFEALGPIDNAGFRLFAGKTAPVPFKGASA